MDQPARKFLQKLVETPSPSGFEQKIQKIIRDRMKETCDDVRQDVHGNVIAALNTKAPMRVMLAGHCDEIGLQVTHIDEKGFIYFGAIGGWDPVILTGQLVDVHGERGVIPGVIGKKPIHLMEQEERGKPVKLTSCWVDIGAKDRKEAQKLIAIGDAITVNRGYTELRNGLAAGRAFDDRVGAWTVVETMRRLSRVKLNVAVYGVSSVQEEMGLRGARTSAFGIDPHVGIAIDVGFASDFPEVDKKIVGDIALGDGPILHRGPTYNPVLARLLVSTAKAKRIPYQMQAETPGGTDAHAIQVTRAGVAAGLLSIPNRYMHTPVEVVSHKDLDNAVALLVATIAGMKAEMSFVP